MKTTEDGLLMVAFDAGLWCKTLCIAWYPVVNLIPATEFFPLLMQKLEQLIGHKFNGCYQNQKHYKACSTWQQATKKYIRIKWWSKSKKYRTDLYEFEFGEAFENQRQDLINSMKAHWSRVRCAQDLARILKIWCSIKKKNPIIFWSWSISFTFLKNWSITYVASFFPLSLLFEVQSTIEKTFGWAFPHRKRIFRRCIQIIAAPSPSHPRPNTSTSWSILTMCLLYATWKFKHNNTPSSY